MKHARIALIVLPALIAACKSSDDKDTIADLHNVKIELKDEKVEGGLDKAMESYKHFLADTPETAMTPEAMRRLADLKIEKEYGIIGGGAETPKPSGKKALSKLEPVKITQHPAAAAAAKQPEVNEELQKDFEQRATATQAIPSTKNADAPLPGGNGLEDASAMEAVNLYLKLLAKYPNYDHNDQVLYQLSRAYDEMGQVDEAMKVMNRLVKEYPNSHYIDEVQFRRGEYFFMRKKFLDAEDAYKAIVDKGNTSYYYELALYKLGWTYYKQQLYEDAQDRFIALLDNKVAIGYNFEKSQNEEDKQRVDDTFRVISLGFSNLGGPDAITEYFQKHGKRPYEADIYSNLGEHYLEKRRYSDAAASFKAFVKQNPYHKLAPRFDMRVIEVYKKGGFPKLVIDANKDFASTYGLKSEYWKHFDVKAYPEVLGYLKTTLKELANHYHALYQDKTLAKDKEQNFAEAEHWYGEFLTSFPKDAESPAINYSLADLLLEHQDYAKAAREYERTAYEYPPHEKSAAAGYAAVYAYRENVKVASAADQEKAKREVIRSSLKFVDTYPTHEKAAVVLGAAVDDLFAMKDYPLAVSTGRQLIEKFPKADQGILRSAWLVVAHSSFQLAKYKDAEEGYVNALKLIPEGDKTRADITENLAASIYKQGEAANKAKDYKTAAEHFLRVAQAAPTSKIRPVADFDGATALIQLKEWDRAAEVLQSFRKNFPNHELQPEATKKIAYVYKESGKLALAAAEYERIETESKDEEVRRSALLNAADLYQQAGDLEHSILVYKRYLSYFPKPLELAEEARFKVAGMYKTRNDDKQYLAELRDIVDADAKGGKERTDRTRYLGGTSALVLTEPLFTQFTQIKLVKPFEKNLARKKSAMKTAIDGFGKLTDYGVGEVTAAVTFYIAEVYFDFSKSLKESERPTNLNELELEQYEDALDAQAFPFEEKAIKVHEKNLELLTRGIYNKWIDKSLEKLAKLVPARYAKPEDSTGYLTSIESFSYQLAVVKPPIAGEKPAAGAPTQGQAPGSANTTSAPGAAGVPAEGSPATNTPASGAQPAASVAPVAPTGSEAGAPGSAPAEGSPPAINAPAPSVQPAASVAPVAPKAPEAGAPAAAAGTSGAATGTSGAATGEPGAAATPAAATPGTAESTSGPADGAASDKAEPVSPKGAPAGLPPADAKNPGKAS